MVGAREVVVAGWKAICRELLERNASRVGGKKAREVNREVGWKEKSKEREWEKRIRRITKLRLDLECRG